MPTPAEALDFSSQTLDKLIDPVSGCPWDKEQTPLTLSEYIIEECFEMVDAIRKNEPSHVCDEMGDLLFLLCHVAKRYGDHFSFADALTAGAQKMRRRHPHVFGDEKLSTREELNASWESIKKQEKASAGESKHTFSALPAGLPSLTKAYRINSKAATDGFTWENDEEVDRQVEAEWLEFLDAKENNDAAAMEHELGDMLFVLTEAGRRMGIKSSPALDAACNRFLRRYEFMECRADEAGKSFKELTLDEKDELWEQSKQDPACLMHLRND